MDISCSNISHICSRSCSLIIVCSSLIAIEGFFFFISFQYYILCGNSHRDSEGSVKGAVIFFINIITLSCLSYYINYGLNYHFSSYILVSILSLVLKFWILISMVWLSFPDCMCHCQMMLIFFLHDTSSLDKGQKRWPDRNIRYVWRLNRLIYLTVQQGA